MRWHSCYTALLFCLLLYLCQSAAAQESAKRNGDAAEHGQIDWVPVATLSPDISSCRSNSPVGYTHHKCLVVIDRDDSVSPPTLLLPGGTTVIIKLINSHWNENVQFNSVTVKTAPEDLLADLLKSLVTPLQSLVVQQKAYKLGGKPQPVSPLAKEQSNIRNELESVRSAIQDATIELTCIETYKPLNESEPRSCVQTASLTNATFANAESQAVRNAQNAATEALPVLEIQAADADVKTEVAKCIALAPKDPSRPACFSTADQYQSDETRYDNDLTSLQTAQATLLQTVQVLTAWPGTAPALAWEILQPKGNNSTVTITATEVVTKTATTVATVTINWQATPFVLSTGILFSDLSYRTFAISPLIINGVPSVDASGKDNTVVTESDTKPSIDFPVVMGSYTIPRFSRYDWEDRCPNHCAFLVTGGIGLDLTSKTAEFAAGPSFQIGGFLFTPSVVWGRQSRLTSGVTVGAQLGSSPPSSLPTENHWVRTWGFALTYTVPTP